MSIRMQIEFDPEFEGESFIRCNICRNEFCNHPAYPGLALHTKVECRDTGHDHCVMIVGPGLVDHIKKRTAEDAEYCHGYLSISLSDLKEQIPQAL
jgi:hypothetical protein